jgi:hypothetical protein
MQGDWKSNSATLIPGTGPYPLNSGHFVKSRICRAIASGARGTVSAQVNAIGFIRTPRRNIGSITPSRLPPKGGSPVIARLGCRQIILHP